MHFRIALVLMGLGFGSVAWAGNCPGSVKWDWEKSSLNAAWSLRIQNNSDVDVKLRVRASAEQINCGDSNKVLNSQKVISAKQGKMVSEPVIATLCNLGDLMDNHVEVICGDSTVCPRLNETKARAAEVLMHKIRRQVVSGMTRYFGGSALTRVQSVLKPAEARWIGNAQHAKMTYNKMNREMHNAKKGLHSIQGPARGCANKVIEELMDELEGLESELSSSGLTPAIICGNLEKQGYSCKDGKRTKPVTPIASDSDDSSQNSSSDSDSSSGNSEKKSTGESWSKGNSWSGGAKSTKINRFGVKIGADRSVVRQQGGLSNQGKTGVRRTSGDATASKTSGLSTQGHNVKKKNTIAELDRQIALQKRKMNDPRLPLQAQHKAQLKAMELAKQKKQLNQPRTQPKPQVVYKQKYKSKTRTKTRPKARSKYQQKQKQQADYNRRKAELLRKQQQELLVKGGVAATVALVDLAQRDPKAFGMLMGISGATAGLGGYGYLLMLGAGGDDDALALASIFNMVFIPGGVAGFGAYLRHKNYGLGLPEKQFPYQPPSLIRTVFGPG